MEKGSPKREGKATDAAAVLTVKCLDDLLKYVPASGENVRIRIPLETKLSEYKKMVEYADSKMYELLDDEPGMGFSWKMRMESKLAGIDQSTENLAKKADILRIALNNIHYDK